MMPLEDVMEHLGAALAALVIIAAVVVGTLVFMRLRAQAFEEYRQARERRAEARRAAERRALEPRPARCPRCGRSMGRVFNGAGWRLRCETCRFWGDTSDAEGRPE